jgi:hypothetical protein
LWIRHFRIIWGGRGVFLLDDKRVDGGNKKLLCDRLTVMIMGGGHARNPEERESGRRTAVPVRTDENDATEFSSQARAFFSSERGQQLGAYIEGVLTLMYEDARGDGAILRRRYGEPTFDTEGLAVAPESARTAIREEAYRLLTSNTQADAIIRYSNGIVVSGSGDTLRAYLDAGRDGGRLRNFLMNFTHQTAMREERTPQAEAQEETAGQFFISERGRALATYIDGLLSSMYDDRRGDGAILRRRYGEPTTDSEGRTVAPEGARTAIREEVYRLLTSTSSPDAIQRETWGLTVSGSGNQMQVELDLRRVRNPLLNYIHQFALQQERALQPAPTAPAVQEGDSPRRRVIRPH